MLEQLRALHPLRFRRGGGVFDKWDRPSSPEFRALGEAGGLGPDSSNTMIKSFLDEALPASFRAPREPAVARLIELLSNQCSTRRRVAVIAQLGDQLVDGQFGCDAAILGALCAFIRDRSPLAASGPRRTVPAKDVQAALNVLASRPRRQGLGGSDVVLDLRDVDLSGAWLASASLRLARFDRSSLRMVDFSYADLEAASFRDADLGGSTLAHSRSTRADFCGARLDNVDLTGAALAESGGFTLQRAMAS